MINLSNLKPAKGAVKKNTRVGRGQGSGGGGTAKRGHKGAKSRSGYSQKRGFEGGQMPLQRRVPKFGFNNPSKIVFKAINLDTLQSLVDNTGVSSVDLGVLYNAGLIQKSDSVKVLGRGELNASLEVRVNAFSKSAIEAIEKAGGKAVVDDNFKPAGSVAIQAKAKVPSGTRAEVKPAKAEPKAKAKPKAEAAAKQPEVEVKSVIELKEEPVFAPAVEPVLEAIAEVHELPKAIEADDLKKIEGIGPKIAELFIADGIDTFQKLADAPIERLQDILTAAGARYASHNPSTWPEQAALAAAGKWEELKELQDKLDGGRPE